MDKQRLKAYLNLIQELLTCPNGEEWIRLRKHEPLVNAELVQVMEQVAAQLALDGDAKSARYLHNWASKLHHIVTQPQPHQADPDRVSAYQDLIQALIKCPDGMEAQILQANQHLLDPGLAARLQQTAQRLATQGDWQTAEFLQDLGDQVNRLWMEAHGFRPELSKEEASEAPQPLKSQPVASPLQESQSPTVPSSPPPQPSSLVSSLTRRPVRSTAARLEENYERLERQLQAVTEAINRLAEMMARQSQSSQPLRHLDALEKACTHGWVLTTEEVEHLIGVKPHCSSGADVYHRGNWDFIKVGRMGTQTGWQVTKSESLTHEVPCPS